MNLPPTPFAAAVAAAAVDAEPLVREDAPPTPRDDSAHLRFLFNDALLDEGVLSQEENMLPSLAPLTPLAPHPVSPLPICVLPADDEALLGTDLVIPSAVEAARQQLPYDVLDLDTVHADMAASLASSVERRKSALRFAHQHLRELLDASRDSEASNHYVAQALQGFFHARADYLVAEAIRHALLVEARNVLRSPRSGRILPLCDLEWGEIGPDSVQTHEHATYLHHHLATMRDLYAPGGEPLGALDCSHPAKRRAL